MSIVKGNTLPELDTTTEKLQTESTGILCTQLSQCLVDDNIQTPKDIKSLPIPKLTCASEKYSPSKSKLVNDIKAVHKIRKVGSNSIDCDILSEIGNMELWDEPGSNDSEHIALSHDLDSIIGFEDYKISSDDLFSSTMWNDAAEDNNEESEGMTEPSLEASINTSCNDTDTVSYTTATDSEHVMKNLENQEENGLNQEGKCVIKQHNIAKLMPLHIKLIHKVLPQHQLSRKSWPKFQSQLQKCEQSYQETFSQAENAIIIQNWLNFCELHHWHPHKMKAIKNWLLNEEDNVGEKHKFAQFLANKLPWRSVLAVLSTFIRMPESYLKLELSKLTKKKNKRLISTNISSCQDNVHIKNSEKLATLSTNSDCYLCERYQTLRKSEYAQLNLQSNSGVKWTLPLIKWFLKKLLCITLSQNINELKYAFLPNVVWKKMEEEMLMDQCVLENFWNLQLHMQLFCPDPIYYNDIKIKLIKYMHKKRIMHADRISWSNVVKYFDGMTTPFLSNTFNMLCQQHSVTAGNVADLYAKIPVIKNYTCDKYLPRIKFHDNGELEVIDNDL